MSASTRSEFHLTGTAGVDASRGQLVPHIAGTLDVSATVWSFGDVFVTDVSLSPVTITPVQLPTVNKAEPPPIEFVSVYFLRAGSFIVTHRGDRLHFGEGLAAYTTDRGRASAISSVPTRVTIVSVPLSRLLARSAGPSHDFGSLGLSAIRTSPLFDFVTALIDIVSVHSIPSEPTATVLTQLVAALILGDREFHRTIADAGLDKQFAKARAAVADRRVMMAMLSVQDAEHSSLSSEEIAAKTGYPNRKALEKALKRAYGATEKI